jgi:ribosomal protein S18 acetylase RimI-like enzyme
MIRVEVREARFPADLIAVRALFEEYATGVGVDLGFQGFPDELAALPGRYARPRGGVWLASDGGEVVGCVALRPLDEGTCEMKRLYVRPAHRGTGLGRVLAERVLVEAAGAGYSRILLDTLPSMGGAIRLYRALGFVEVAAYCHNPIPGALFLGRELVEPHQAGDAPG